MANDGTVKIGTELDDSGFKSGLSKLGSVASTALKGSVAVIGSVATAASGAVAGLLALESATEEYRIAQGKLNTAFEAAGYGPEAAAQAYNDFYAILGDTDTATEASQLLAKLADNQEDLSTWTRIAAGVNGTFGDSLPIEGLIEAANETAKVGTVTGTLADALNWAGISEDEFNVKLSECTDESERNQLIMDTLAATYDEASDAFYRNNAALVASREAQAQMDSALAQLGAAVSDVKTRMMADFLPSISQVTEGLAGMLSGTEGAEEQFSQGIQSLIDTGVEKLPEFLDFGVQILTSILDGIISNIPAILEAIPQVVEAIASALVEMWPSLIESGNQILDQIGNGILQYIPQLLTMLPDVIVAIVDFLTENFPTILEKGAEFLGEFATGIIDAIPDMVAKLPEVISAFVDFVSENFPEIVKTGVSLLGQLAVGIIKAIPDLVKSLPNVITAVVDGFGDLMGSLVEVGKDMVRGLWDGISDMASWIKNKVSGFVGGIVDSVKGVLGIHSPSTVMRDQVGKNIGLGVAEGIEDSATEAQSAANQMAKDLAKAIPSVTMGVQYANAGMVPSSLTPSMEYAYASAPAGADASVLTELRAIRDAVLAGQVLMVDKRVLGQVTASANRTKTRMLGVEAY